MNFELKASIIIKMNQRRDFGNVCKQIGLSGWVCSCIVASIWREIKTFESAFKHDWYFPDTLRVVSELNEKLTKISEIPLWKIIHVISQYNFPPKNSHLVHVFVNEKMNPFVCEAEVEWEWSFKYFRIWLSYCRFKFYF